MEDGDEDGDAHRSFGKPIKDPLVGRAVAASRWAIPLLVLFSLAGAATAQVPTLPASPPGEAGVEVKASQAQVVVSLDRGADVEVTVTNTGRPSNIPAFDRPRTVTLALSQMPAGWQASAPQPAELKLGPGASGTAKFTISVSGEAQEEAASVTVTAKMYALGVDQVPVAGPQADPEATAATVVKATRTDSVTRDVLETVGPYIWVVLLGFVAAVVLALSLMAANRRVAVRLSSPEAEQAIQAGGRGAFPLRVHNITRQADTVFLRASPLPEGWAAYLPTPQLDLDPGQQEEVSVVVIPPKEADAGATQSVDVTATSALAPRRPATMRFEATVAAGRKRPA